jgi:hypothetical protein
MLFINGRFVSQRITGVQRYAIEMTKALIASGASPRVLLSTKAQLPEWLPEELCERIPSFGKSGMADYICYWLIAPILLVWRYRDHSYHVWSPCNVGSPLFKNHFVTIHDLAIRENYKWFSPAFVLFYRVCFCWYSLIRNPVATVSKFSAAEIVRYYPSLVRRVFLTPNGINIGGLTQPVKPPELLNLRPYILCVASKDPRKNTDFIIRSWLNSDLGFLGNIVFVGGNNSIFFNPHKKNESSVQSVIDLGYVSEANLEWLYLNCRAVVQASSYEGYGLPVTEALMRGGMVICSDIPAFREVAGNAAKYFKLFNENDLIDSMNLAFQLDYVPQCVVKYYYWNDLAILFSNSINTFSPLSNFGDEEVIIK